MSDFIDLAQAVSRLLRADNILLLCHKNPDGDTVGSAAALYHVLRALGKTVAVLCADPIPARYEYMEIEQFAEQFTPQFIVAVDVAGIQLFGDSIQEYTKRIDLCVDHHPSNSGYALETVLDGDAAAAAQVVYDLALTMQAEITPLIADCLYTGLATDTGCFKFTNTNKRTHEVAAKLIEAGAHTKKLNNLLFQNKSRSRLAAESLALQNLEYYFEDCCAIISLTREQIAATGAENTDLEGITAIPRAIEGVKIGVTMRQQENGSYKISVRTEEGYNASAICANLGGGGHAQAAGCEVLGSFENTKNTLLAEVEKALKAPKPVSAEA